MSSSSLGNRTIGVEDLLGVPLGFFCLPEQLVCAGGNGTCVEGLCSCPAGQVPQGDQCVARQYATIPAGGECLPEDNCLYGTRCDGTGELIGSPLPQRAKVR